MRNVISLLILLLLIPSLVIGCEQEIKEEKDHFQFTLHKATPESEEPAPFLSSKDTEAYRWDGQTLQVKVDQIYDRLGMKPLRQGFVLKINNKNQYYGEFWSILSSATPDKRVKTFFLDDRSDREFIELYEMDSR